ncbi:serine/threonine-protein phosphatase 6 regulatory ankyrin repeat subunit A-like isoform X1 [Patella vulgata]|uniref:serine/threonine-protein phosphatase 6 regulatory ankyrin repeat subunit A-like isoform X1 n=1 Tax=Patella vulgata TaxID=6465 RepID=UPI0024A85EA2|nr:serine/threonine-protein phosphatase 6 regulatory ankyrin repeat subunit A-like isoform X1 [Patella vulgata]
MNLLNEKEIGDLSALPHLVVYSDKFDIVNHVSNFTNFDKSKRDNKSRTILHNACDSKHDNHQIINFLIDRAFDVNARDDSGSTPPHLAVARGKKETVSILISQEAEVNAKDDMGRLPIHIVCSSYGGRTDVDVTQILNQLIEAGSFLHKADKLNRIPLLEIIANDDIKCFEILINKMTSFDPKYIQTIIGEATKLQDNSMLTTILDRILPYGTDSNLFNKSILFICCESVDKMRILNNKGMDFNVVDENNRSILHHSCRRGSIDTVHYLVNEIGLNINQKDKTGWTPVCYSVMSDIDPIKKLEFLLSRGCSLQVLDDDNCSLLHISCGYGELETVEYLVNQIGLDVHHKDNDGNTPVVFCSASSINPVKKLKFLSSKGASLHAVDYNNRSLLHRSGREGTLEAVKYLVDEIELDINYEDNEGLTPVMFCCLSSINPIEKLKFLSSKGVNLRVVVNNNNSLVHASCVWSTIETVEYLINDIGLDVHYKDNNGWTPAMCCSVSKINPISKLKFLSSKGVSLHTVDNDNNSLLHVNCRECTIETVEYLVNDVGLDVHYKDNKGNTPAKCCSVSTINPISKLKFLSSKGVNLRVVGNNNMSLLHFSCLAGTVETVEYLVNDIGLDVHYKTNEGNTPAAFCSASKINPISKLKFLSSKGVSLHTVDNNNNSLLHVSC